MCDQFNLSNLLTGCGDGDDRFHDGHVLVLFMREHIAKPPNASADKQNCAEDADGSAGDKSCEEQCGAESQSNRPRSRRGKAHCALCMLPCLCQYVRTHSQFLFINLFLATDDVNDSKYHDPHPIYEMPVKRQHVHTFGMLLF